MVHALVVRLDGKGHFAAWRLAAELKPSTNLDWLVKSTPAVLTNSTKVGLGPGSGHAGSGHQPDRATSRGPAAVRSSRA